MYTFRTFSKGPLRVVAGLGFGEDGLLGVRRFFFCYVVLPERD